MMSTPLDKTVLVVDDEEGIRLYLQTALEDAGFNVETAEDGLQALEKVHTNPPDAISLDLVMPKKTGAKFLYEVHKDKELRKIPVLIVTAHARDELGKQDFEDIMSGRMLVGPKTYLEKPVNAEVYVNSIKRVLGMETEEETGSPKEEIRHEIDDLLNEADPKKMEEILNILKNQ